MTKGELEFAIWQAFNVLDAWNNVTGCFPKGTSYYYEMQSVVEDAVKIGAKIACEGINADLSEIINEHVSEDDEFQKLTDFLMERRLTGHT